MRSWAPDVEVDCDIARGIVTSQFPEFAELTPSFLGRGWDNYCVEYPDGTVFRLPTRNAGAEILQNEILALPIVRQEASGLHVPEFRHLGEPRNGYPYPFVGYPKIPGVTADQVNLSPDDKRRAAATVGGFLRGLHSVDAAQPALDSLPRDDPSKHDATRILEKLRTRLPIVESAIGGLTPTLRRALDNAEAAALEKLKPYNPVLLHGDLYPRHVLAQNHEVTGIIDWGDVQISDPAVDLSIAYTFFGAEERPVFWAAYGRPESEFNRPLMLVRAAMYGFALLAYGIDEEDVASVAAGEAILARLSDTP